MAKGQHLTKYQQGIVKRYYEHKGTVSTQKLGEMVSELYLSARTPRAEKLWQQAETALRGAGVGADEIKRVVSSRKPEELARVVAKLSPGAR